MVSKTRKHYEKILQVETKIMDNSKVWNPMEEAYKNVDFNRYVEGPGANLNPQLQPGYVASNNPKTNNNPINEAPIFQICLRNVNMNNTALFNLCSNFAKISNIRRATRVPYVFVTFPTLNDMERCLTGLKENKHGIIAQIAKNSMKYVTPNATSGPGPSTSSESGCSVDSRKDAANIAETVNVPIGIFNNMNFHNSQRISSSSIDLSKREFKENIFSNPPRPIHDRNPLAILNAGRTPIYAFDAGVNNRSSQEIINQKERSDAIQKMRKSNESSKGKYNVVTDTFTKASKFNNEPKIGLCKFCKKPTSSYCQRCEEFYCSFECQKKDWSNHKYVCYKMPDLVLVDNSKQICSNVQPSTSNATRKDSNMKSITNTKVPKENENISKNTSTPKPASVSRSNGKNCGKQVNKKELNLVGNSSNLSNGTPAIKPEVNKKSAGSSLSNPVESKQQFSTTPKASMPINTGKPSEKLKEEISKKASPLPSSVPSPILPKSGSLVAPIPISTEKPSSTSSSSEKLKENQLSSSTTTPTFPKNGSLVAITAFCKTNMVYIRSLAPEDDKEYIQLLNKIANVGRKSKPITKLPAANDILLSDYQGNGDSRVLILKAINTDNVLVSYIDFGNVETRKLCEIRELPSEYKFLKRYVFPVHLKNVPDIQISPEIRNYLSSFAEDEGIELKVIYSSDAESEPPIHEIDLICLSTNESLNKKIIEMSDIKVPSLSDEPVFVKDIENKLIEPGENVPVYIYDNSLICTGMLAIIHEKDVLPLQEFNKRIEEYVVKDNSPYTPRQDELCLAKYENSKWYRAECLEVVGDQHPSLVFIDYGNIIPVSIENIRKYPKELQHPCTTSISIISGLPQDVLSKEAEKKLKELLPLNGKIIADKITIERDEDTDDEANFIYLTDVLEKLKELKFI